ncbi:MAG: hypothetical protein ACK56I_11515, partial [bacterium]
ATGDVDDQHHFPLIGREIDRLPVESGHLAGQRRRRVGIPEGHHSHRKERQHHDRTHEHHERGSLSLEGVVRTREARRKRSLLAAAEPRRPSWPLKAVTPGVSTDRTS